MSKDDSFVGVLQQEYLSQIRKALPLHRLLAFLGSIAIIIQVKTSEYKSVTEGLLKSSIKSFFDIDDGYFSTLVVQDTLLALAILVLGYLFHLMLLRYLFIFIKKHLRLDSVIEKLVVNSEGVSDNTIYTYLSLKKSELEASKFKNKISYLSSISEIAASIGILFVYASYYGNIIDASISFVCFICSIYFQHRALLVFLQNYLPHNAHIQGILGIHSKVELP